MREIVGSYYSLPRRNEAAFVLAKVDNLVKNVSLSKLIGTVVGLNIRMVGEASETGNPRNYPKSVEQKSSSRPKRPI